MLKASMDLIVGRLVGRGEDKSIADLQPPGRDASGDDSAGVEFVHILNRKTKRLFGSCRSLFESGSVFPARSDPGTRTCCSLRMAILSPSLALTGIIYLAEPP